ncbi:hypothetical protein RhiirA1_437391 [Rhizophagus irregularis]|uniref:Uncharacterized protein n=2 Tax=Rhizophagus irregularis TaxID=588596 RepID=A0A2I1EHD1_9GLOM|nr:hypothetical protein GLOIN_2v1486127 [Rhizophagus irregularis DAOM 181602=DAOM 197198]PKC73764.1 hypothetical protein RhiirA1_437391 [Rhizophagus irregularis]PKY21529.1 hypothetical protein RhiirB3_500705 [Rhizophagus irregularis]POG61594.1 hypothetical protein GLOIN_2v1486127 [Rhizophagus irregularis DAOM 181602=DAOM 197198]|eukprot:XP_025168460.1 hypothetical protein GLOIN_2v1486127 [Rhizophagus irregularis DAOM 181602=DAOM 197198]
MSELPPTATSTTYKLHAPNYADLSSSNNNESFEKKYKINSPSTIDNPYKTTPSTTPSPPSSPSKKDLSSIANVSSRSINNNNKENKQTRSVKFQNDDDNDERLILALTLYSLILVNIIYIYEKKERNFWLEILIQTINLEFTFLTIVGYPKRIRNLPRAIKIWWADRRGEIPTRNSYSSRYSEIQKIQISVTKDYKWYVYDTLDFSLNCTPTKLLSIILIWNIGSLAQYGISGILWFIPPIKRPVIPYIILTLIASISELVPIPVVVIQSKRARMANNFEIRYNLNYSIQDAC